jgi:hypothetical protein
MKRFGYTDRFSLSQNEIEEQGRKNFLFLTSRCPYQLHAVLQNKDETNTQPTLDFVQCAAANKMCPGEEKIFQNCTKQLQGESWESISPEEKKKCLSAMRSCMLRIFPQYNKNTE